tara:strand:- start:7168 stop:7329 length:162 start_codon:yes stop_codon:yes gene_type:complete
MITNLTKFGFYMPSKLMVDVERFGNNLYLGIVLEIKIATTCRFFCFLYVANGV